MTVRGGGSVETCQTLVGPFLPYRAGHGGAQVCLDWKCGAGNALVPCYVQWRASATARPRTLYHLRWRVGPVVRRLVWLRISALAGLVTRCGDVLWLWGSLREQCLRPIAVHGIG